MLSISCLQIKTTFLLIVQKVEFYLHLTKLDYLSNQTPTTQVIPASYIRNFTTKFYMFIWYEYK